MRTAHLIASAAWLGGSLFYALALRPHLGASEQARNLSPAVARSFGRVVSASAWTLLASGGYLSFARLTNTRLDAPYAPVLALKVALAVWMFLLAGALGRNRGKTAPIDDLPPSSGWRLLLPVPTLILVLGLVVFVLSALLTTLYGAS